MGRFIEERHKSDMQVNGEWLSTAYYGALINDQPIKTYQAKDMPSHDWLEEAGVETTPGSLGVSELSLEIIIGGDGNTATQNYARFVNAMVGRVNTFYFPMTGETWNNLLFARTANPKWGVNGENSYITFTLTMKSNGC